MLEERPREINGIPIRYPEHQFFTTVLFTPSPSKPAAETIRCETCNHELFHGRVDSVKNRGLYVAAEYKGLEHIGRGHVVVCEIPEYSV